MSVIVWIRILVRLSKANEIWNNYSVSCLDKDWDHLSVEERPRGFTMKAKNDMTITRTLIHIMNSWQLYSTTSINTQVVRLEVVSKFIKIFKSFLWCSDNNWHSRTKEEPPDWFENILDEVEEDEDYHKEKQKANFPLWCSE